MINNRMAYVFFDELIYFLCMEILKSHKFKIIVLIFILIFLIYRIYVTINYTYITAEFRELRPFHGKVPVYYKGFKIGKCTKIVPSDDYEKTIVSIVLYPKNLYLPKNVIVKLKKHKRFRIECDFMEIVYPDEPYLERLKNKDVIVGKQCVDIRDFFANQDKDSLEDMRKDASQTFKNLNNAINEIADLFITLDEIALESKKNIVTSTNNLNKATRNFEQISMKINRAMEYKKVNRIVSSIDKSSQNFGVSSGNLDKLIQEANVVTNQINQTIPQIKTTICYTNSILRNVDDISYSLKSKLGKPFAGFRLLFGKSIEKK